MVLRERKQGAEAPTAKGRERGRRSPAASADQGYYVSSSGARIKLNEDGSLPKSTDGKIGWSTVVPDYDFPTY